MSSEGVVSNKETGNNLDFVLLQDSSLVLAVGLQPQINFSDCL